VGPTDSSSPCNDDGPLSREIDDLVSEFARLEDFDAAFDKVFPPTIRELSDDDVPLEIDGVSEVTVPNYALPAVLELIEILETAWVGGDEAVWSSVASWLSRHRNGDEGVDSF